MPLVSAKCTHCGCEQQVDTTKESTICHDCGQPFIVEKGIIVPQW